MTRGPGLGPLARPSARDRASGVERRAAVSRKPRPDRARRACRTDRAGIGLVKALPRDHRARRRAFAPERRGHQALRAQRAGRREWVPARGALRDEPAAPDCFASRKPGTDLARPPHRPGPGSTGQAWIQRSRRRAARQASAPEPVVRFAADYFASMNVAGPVSAGRREHRDSRATRLPWAQRPPGARPPGVGRPQSDLGPTPAPRR